MSEENVKLRAERKKVKACVLILDTLSSMRIGNFNKKAGTLTFNAWRDLNKALIILENQVERK